MPKFNRHIQRAIDEKLPLYWKYERGEFLLIRQTAFHETGHVNTCVCYRTHTFAPLIALSERLMQANKPCSITCIYGGDINLFAHGWKPEFSDRLDAINKFRPA